jgi:RNA polymerase sigma-70 factor (ECF subfamily)
LTDDSVLWKKICRGEADEFDRFYSETAPRLFSFLHRVVGNRQVAEDIMQEAYMQLWRRPDRYQPNRGTLRAYLYGIARKQASEWWRKQSSQITSPEDITVPSAETDSVQDAFGRLTEEQQTLLWLREVEGQSYAELAQFLEIPIGTVRSRLFTAREQLRRIWHSPLRNRKEVV